MSNQSTQIFAVKQLQLWVGSTAFFLPIVLWGVGRLLGIGNPWPWPVESISDYHGTNLRAVFVGALATIGILMLCYRGYERTARELWSDNVLANIAGTAALLVAAIPNDPDCQSFGQVFAYPLAKWLHFAAAGTVYLSMFWFAAFRFTKSQHATRSARTPSKQRRNVVYVFCAALIVLSMALLLVGFLVDLWQYWPNGIFYLEWLGMSAFGFAWLTKSKMLPKLGD